MPETPRSSKRRRLNSSPAVSSADQSTRRSARTKPVDDDVFDVIEVTASPVYDVDELRSARSKNLTPSRQSLKKGTHAQSPNPAKSPRTTPAKSRQRAQRTPQNGSKAEDKSSLRTTRHRHAVETGNDEVDELALPAEDVLDELDTSTPGQPQRGSTKRSRPVATGRATTNTTLANGTPSKSKKSTGRSTKLVAQAHLDNEDGEDAMDVDGDELESEIAVNGAHAVTNGLSVSSHAAQPPSDQFNTLKSVALSKLSQRRPTPLKNLDSEYAKVHQLLHATVTAGESNSLLLIGARGSGKTAMINATLQDLSRSQKEHFHTIRLNGFIQTDDKLALREIWRQLGREMEISEAEDGGGKSYADTLTMLLALLSHPDEIAGTSSDGGKVAKSVIFIMDEFDLFATHARQTLLYNLLDIAQSRKAPIAVVGLTTRIDVTEALEKRVKSRFSHRYVHLSLPKTLSDFVDVAKSAVQIQSEELAFEEKVVLFGGDVSNEPMTSTKTAKTKSSVNVVDDWNTAVETLFTSSSFLKTYVHPIYYTTKSIPALLSGLLVPFSSLTALPVPSDFRANTTNGLLTPPDSNLHILPALSELALSLLIAACRLSIIHSTDTTNFPLAYAEFVSLASKARINSAASGALASGAGTRVFGKEVARREWEKLVGYGLMVPLASGAFGLGAVSSGAGKGMEMVRVDVALEEIPLSVEMSAVMEKWCLQI